MYDTVLLLELPRGCETVAFADDLMLEATTKYELIETTNDALNIVKKCFDDHGLVVTAK